MRAIGHPFRLSSVQNAIEDENLDVDQLAVYNGDPKVAATQVLPHNTVFAIKEPYYKAAADGGYIVRVDHPSDLIKLQPTHNMVPAKLAPRLLELDEDALKYKNIGNAAFKTKDYLPALEAYTQGLNACSNDDDLLRRDLYRNRSIVNTHICRYEQAATDAVSALFPNVNGDEANIKNNVKALFRAGRACYCLENLAEAKSYFEQLLEISPADEDGRQQIARTKARLEESLTGKYDFEAMSKSVSGSHKHLDHASFTANVEVRPSTKKGRGLFATKNITAGELVLVEKAFAVAFESEAGSETHIILNLNTNTGRIGSHAVLFYQLVQKMLHNPSQARRALDLFDGGYSPKCTAQTVDGATAIDTFQVAAIMEHNAFGCPNTCTVDELGTKKASKKNDPSGSVGIWVVASYFNHACDANVRRAFFGDIMIVRATKDISKGQEIFIPYRSPEYDYVKTQEAFGKVWKFKCDCGICTAESKTSTTHRKERQALIKEMNSFLEKYADAPRYTADEAMIAKAEKLYAKLEATYDKKSFDKVPRLPLAHLGEWLCAVYQTEKNMHKVIDTAHAVLRNMGYGVTVVGKSLRVDRTHCYAEIVDIDAAMYAAHACFYFRNEAIGKQYETFAKERYLTMNGEMRKFVERYGDSEKML